MAETIAEVRDKLKQTFFPEFSKYMERVKDALETMDVELEGVRDKLEEIKEKIEDIETEKEELLSVA